MPLRVPGGTPPDSYNRSVPGRLRSFGAQLALVAAVAMIVRFAWVWGFGRNQQGLLAPTEQDAYLSPVRRPELRGVVALSAGTSFAVARLANGTVRTWGGNGVNQIGDGVSVIHTTPARVRLPCRFTGMPSREHRDSEAKHCPD